LVSHFNRSTSSTGFYKVSFDPAATLNKPKRDMQATRSDIQAMSFFVASRAADALSSRDHDRYLETVARGTCCRLRNVEEVHVRVVADVLYLNLS